MITIWDVHPTLRRHLALVDDCWVWFGSREPKRGYGRYGPTPIGGQGRMRTWYVHRLVWTLMIGPIPDGMQVDHRCRRKACCRPDHLRLVTPIVNQLENSDAVGARNAAKTHCPSGHPYSPENTYRIPSRPRFRFCRACRRAARRR